MGKKKEEQTLPLNMESDSEPSSSIIYADEVIAIIAGLAASEVEGVAGMVSVNSGLKGKYKNVTRGVKVEVGTEEVSIDLYLNVEYGTPIPRAAHDAQESVKKSIESMTGLHVVRVDVHVMGVSFEKENKALQAGAGKAVLEAGDPADAGRKAEPSGQDEVKTSPAASEEPREETPAAPEEKPDRVEDAPAEAEAETPEAEAEAENADVLKEDGESM